MQHVQQEPPPITLPLPPSAAWIEQDPERAPIIRQAFDLLLEDRLSLEGICEEPHSRGYHYRSGRPFVEINKRGE